MTENIESLQARIAELERERVVRMDERDEVIRLLRLAARGRREYARGGSESQHVLTDVQILTAEAQNFESAAKIAEGNIDPLHGLLPVWMWGEAGLA